MKKLYEKILSVLCDDARMPLDTVAAMIGEEEAVVKAAVADMEQSGIIVKYTAIVNDERAGKSDVEALIEVKVSPVRETGFDEIAQYIYQFPEVKSVFLMSGRVRPCGVRRGQVAPRLRALCVRKTFRDRQGFVVRDPLYP